MSHPLQTDTLPKLNKTNAVENITKWKILQGMYQKENNYKFSQKFKCHTRYEIPIHFEKKVDTKFFTAIHSLFLYIKN